MAKIRTVHSEENVKVAVVFEPGGKVRPVWFEVLGKERVQVSEICGVRYHSQGSARIINFDIRDSQQRYQLTYNTEDLSWSVGLTVIE